MGEATAAALAVLVSAALATFAWRALGVVFSGRIDPDGSVFAWVACVAYALLAGLVARMILLPLGPLAEVPLPARVAAAVVALAIFFLTRRNLLAGIVAGVVALALFIAGWR